LLSFWREVDRIGRRYYLGVNLPSANIFKYLYGYYTFSVRRAAELSKSKNDILALITRIN